jgi:hypothetical protein
MRRHRQTRPVDERKVPFSVGLDIGNTLHHAYVVNAKSTICMPKARPFANMRAGYMQLFAMLTEATAHAAPAEVTVGCGGTLQGLRDLAPAAGGSDGLN